jgi:hypothetical protein
MDRVFVNPTFFPAFDRCFPVADRCSVLNKWRSLVTVDEGLRPANDQSAVAAHVDPLDPREANVWSAILAVNPMYAAGRAACVTGTRRRRQ